MKKFAALGIALVLVGCTDAKKATDVLESQGYTNIQIGGYSYFGCSESDSVHTEFTATGVNGKPVSGVVCSSWWGKGATVRFY